MSSGARSEILPKLLGLTSKTSEEHVMHLEEYYEGAGGGEKKALLGELEMGLMSEFGRIVDPKGLDEKTNHLRGNNLLRTVDELIDPRSGQWDDQLIRQTFWAEDVATILAVPVRLVGAAAAGWSKREGIGPTSAAPFLCKTCPASGGSSSHPAERRQL